MQKYIIQHSDWPADCNRPRFRRSFYQKSTELWIEHTYSVIDFHVYSTQFLPYLPFQVQGPLHSSSYLVASMCLPYRFPCYYFDSIRLHKDISHFCNDYRRFLSAFSCNTLNSITQGQI